METQKLPRANAVLILGILSLLTCCCLGLPGLIFGAIAFFMAKKDMELYQQNPQLYSNYSTLNTGRIIAIIGLVLSFLVVLLMIYRIATLGWDGVMDIYNEATRAYEEGQRQGSGSY